MTVGVDVVDVERVRSLLVRNPAFFKRAFSEKERKYCETKGDPALRYAGTWAAKEAIMKAAGLTPAPAWARRIEIQRAPDGAPVAEVEGRSVSLSISHDGGVAVAV